LSRTGTNSLKGKSYEEIHGDEAEKIKENLSIKIKQGRKKVLKFLRVEKMRKELRILVKVN
jgi:hypothetical protein